MIRSVAGRRAGTVIVAALCVIALSREARSQEKLYQWTDDRGVVHVVTDPGDIPDAYRDEAEEKVFEERKTEIPASLGSTPAVAPVPGAPPAAAGARATALPPPPPGAIGTGKVDRQGRDEGWWKARAEALRIQIRELEGRIVEANKKIYSPLIDVQQQGHEEKEALQAALEEARNRLEKELPAEAEAAGADAAWVR